MFVILGGFFCHPTSYFVPARNLAGEETHYDLLLHRFPTNFVKELLFEESSPQNIKPRNLHGPMGAHGGPWGPWALWGHVAHEAHMGPWGTTRRELKVPSGIAPRNRHFKELRLLCQEFRNSLTSEKRVLSLFVGSSFVICWLGNVIWGSAATIQVDVD